ncbi:hypothetical protein KEM48_014229 [Puccinia striiformis f. sp. tritici PST-130]|nr:hypothetical protein KEM48_014229 [Puccinia striiformis f. sp. tritici PST-130]
MRYLSRSYGSCQSSSISTVGFPQPHLPMWIERQHPLPPNPTHSHQIFESFVAPRSARSYSGPISRLILVEWLSATMWKTGPFPWLRANPPIPPPKLSDIIGSVYKAMDSRFEQTPVANIPTDSRITIQRQARLAYIRTMINLNRLRRIANPGQTAFPSFWDDIDADLETRRTKNTQRSIKCLDTLSSKRIIDSGMVRKSLTTGPTSMFNSQPTRRFRQGLHRRQVIHNLCIRLGNALRPTQVKECWFYKRLQGVGTARIRTTSSRSKVVLDVLRGHRFQVASRTTL